MPLQIYTVYLQSMAYCAFKLSTWRTTTGAEVDAVVETPEEVIPVEVKWTDSPQSKVDGFTAKQVVRWGQAPRGKHGHGNEALFGGQLCKDPGDWGAPFAL